MIDSNDSNDFMKDTYANFLKKLNNKDSVEFSKLKNNFDRFEFIHNLPLIREYKVQISESSKNAEEANLLKEKGNAAFQKGDYRKAMDLYTRSLLKSPSEKENSELSIIRANRSAALYHLEKYHQALTDIEEALRHGYPTEMLYKLKDRKAKCLLALKQHKSGLRALQETLTALDDAKIPTDRRLKWQKDIQIMISMMTKNNVKDENISKRDTKDGEISHERNPVYVAASDAIEIKCDPDAGRYAAARRDIKVGEVFLTEEAHCSILLEHQAETHCFHCMRRTEIGEPCTECDRVRFCSVKCRRAALTSYHSVECKILESLWKSGLSVTCLMALRIFSQRNPKYFLKLKDKLMSENCINWSNQIKYHHSDYLTVSQLVTHEKKRTSEALLQKTFVAVYLFKCLQEASYFKDIKKEDEKECFKLIGGLILKNLQLLQFNAHGIFELECPKVDLNMSKSKFIGAAIYPTLALFNHSCNPGIVRYFEGTKVIARAVRPIKKGQLVAENYGPIFTEMKREQRQRELAERYWFECKCEACAEEWPLLSEMDTGSLRYRCENKACQSVILVPVNTMDFMIQCNACQKYTNILKGLKVLQDSENLFRLGLELMRSGDARKAVQKYRELLELLDENLVPPFRDYHLCQQGLRTCFLSEGNTYKIFLQ